MRKEGKGGRMRWEGDMKPKGGREVLYDGRIVKERAGKLPFLLLGGLRVAYLLVVPCPWC